MMDFDFMPLRYRTSLSNNIEIFYEVRLRKDFPVKVKCLHGLKYLTYNGISDFANNAIICNEDDIKQIISSVTEHSLYAHNDRIKQGFLITKDGIRIGLAGECVFDNNNIITVKNFTSLNIRIPHEVKGCSDKIFPIITKKKGVFNTLIISPAMLGKTTILKDLARKLSKQNIGNILIIDERGEFCKIREENVDIISFSDKLYAFDFGLRSMSPNIVITDELSSKLDWEYVEKASRSGVNIIASCHALSINDVKRKKFFNEKVFERYVVIKDIGEIENIYDEAFNII